MFETSPHAKVMHLSECAVSASQRLRTLFKILRYYVYLEVLLLGKSLDIYCFFQLCHTDRIERFSFDLEKQFPRVFKSCFIRQ